MHNLAVFGVNVDAEVKIEATAPYVTCDTVASL